MKRLLVPIALIALYVGQCFWFIGTQSLTYDEPTHLFTGLEAWRYGRFEQWNDQPPFARLLLAAPLARGDWHLEPLQPPLNGAFWTFDIRPSPAALAWHTRPLNVALGVVLACLLWLAARRMFSETAANAALAFFAFSPPLIAHFSLATVDGAATLAFFATVLLLIRWRHDPSWLVTIAAGIVIGIFLTAKFSAPPLALLVIAVMMASRTATSRTSERVAKAGFALAVAIATVWATYFFHVGPITFRNGPLAGPYPSPRGVVVPVGRPLELTLQVPAPEYFAALGRVAQHAVKGQPAFLLGRIRKSGGWRTYYPVVAALKWPIVVLVTTAFALLLLLRGNVARPQGLGFIVAFPALYLALATASNLDIGDRYILPVFPFLLLIGAAGWNAIVQRRWAVPLLVALITLQALDCLRYAPDYLSYFNVFVPSDRSYEWLTDSNLDWGQGLLALERYERDHPADRISLAYFGGVDPRTYHIRARPLAAHDRATGTVIVSATHLSGQYLSDAVAYRWLLDYPRRTVLNHTLHVFDVPDGMAR